MGKAKRAHLYEHASKVGTAQERLCPPYKAFSVIARSEATKQSIAPQVGAVDCFASLAMTEDRLAKQKPRLVGRPDGALMSGRSRAYLLARRPDPIVQGIDGAQSTT